jgi:hypothetical protein
MVRFYVWDNYESSSVQFWDKTWSGARTTGIVCPRNTEFLLRFMFMANQQISISLNGTKPFTFPYAGSWTIEDFHRIEIFGADVRWVDPKGEVIIKDNQIRYFLPVNGSLPVAMQVSPQYDVL